MGIGGNKIPVKDMNKKDDRHYEDTNKSLFPVEVADSLKAAVEARGLSQEQAAKEIGIPLNTIIQIYNGGSPKGARRIKTKIKTWLAAHEKQEGA
jgi:DNA-binding XRE family transcriptional regulator